MLSAAIVKVRNKARATHLVLGAEYDIFSSPVLCLQFDLGVEVEEGKREGQSPA